MQSAEDDGLSAELKGRLRRELDAIPPRIALPRYANPRRPILWRLAPAALAAALVGFLAVSGYAETGSTNPAVWRDKAVNLIRPERQAPTSDENEHRDQRTGAPTQATEAHSSPEPGDRTEPSESQDNQDSSESHDSSQTSDNQSGAGSSDGGASETSTTSGDR